jgi:hypothetical protein
MAKSNKGNVNQFLRNPFAQQQQQPVFQGIKTKKYQLETKIYIRIAMENLLRSQWYWMFVPLAIIMLNLVLNLTGAYRNLWIYFTFPPLLIIGYVLFWAIQFTGVTQLQQNKPLFQKMAYEIDSKQILMKLNSKEGMQIKWEMIKSVKKAKDHYLLMISKAQFLHLPFDIFNSENDLRFFEALLKRKNLLPEVKTVAKK